MYPDLVTLFSMLNFFWGEFPALRNYIMGEFPCMSKRVARLGPRPNHSQNCAIEGGRDARWFLDSSWLVSPSLPPSLHGGGILLKKIYLFSSPTFLKEKEEEESEEFFLDEKLGNAPTSDLAGNLEKTIGNNLSEV